MQCVLSIIQFSEADLLSVYVLQLRVVSAMIGNQGSGGGGSAMSGVCRTM